MSGKAELIGDLIPDGLPAGQSRGWHPVEGRQARLTAIKRRLPRFLIERADGAPLPPQELLGRVKDQRLVAAVKGASWGGPGLLLLGPTASGKSSAAGWLFRRLLWVAASGPDDTWVKAEGLHWFNADTLATARAQHPLGHGEAPELGSAMRASLLFLDDAGWDRDPAAVSEVLRERYERMLPTVLTSGRTAAELDARYGDAVARRLREQGGGRATLVNCHKPRAVE